MKKLHNTIAIAAMFLIIIAVLITSFQIAIYGDPEYKFYRNEYVKHEVEKDLQMEITDIMDVTEKMMDYLIGEREELSADTIVNGEERDFFNEQDRLHMADVKNLFLGGLKLRWILLGGAVLLLALLVILKGDWKHVIPKAYFISLGIFGGLTVILGALFASDFTKYFTIFHEIFFTNDLWLFDPKTDLMIRMLPEGFFYDMVIRIGMIFLAALLVIYWGFQLWRRIVKKYENKNNL